MQPPAGGPPHADAPPGPGAPDPSVSTRVPLDTPLSQVMPQGNDVDMGPPLVLDPSVPSGHHIGGSSAPFGAARTNNLAVEGQSQVPATQPPPKAQQPQAHHNTEAPIKSLFQLKMMKI